MASETSVTERLLKKTYAIITDQNTLLKSFKHFVYCRSDKSYSKRDEFRWLYLCMKITRVSDDLFYFYLLAGKCDI
jgi:hypothetical protein